ncbi:hypothetical protein ABT246_24470 [Streptomyces sp. NPDC001553]|uniref:hypothetical protein n=1 Tax=Streptomyces sp. NPDC001553 TaxID=3154385 RepID=UPI0033291684
MRQKQQQFRQGPASFAGPFSFPSGGVMYRIVVAEQHRSTFRGYRLEDLDDKDATAIREGRIVLAAIGLERRRDDDVWVRKAEKINFAAPRMPWASTHTSRRSPTRKPGSEPPTCGAPRSKRWSGRKPSGAGS